MRLEHLCDMQLAYRHEALYDGTAKMLAPYGTLEGKAYGEGDISFQGERFTATGRWANHPRRRSDGVNLSDVHGSARTEDGAFVLVGLQGRTLPAVGDTRRQLLTVLFETDDERYAWMNAGVCVLEGAIAPSTGAMRARIFECVHELE